MSRRIKLKFIRNLYKVYVDVFPVHIFLIYILSFLFPRNRKLWVFGGMSGILFTDNTKQLFMYINSLKQSQIKSVWITKDKNIALAIRQMGMRSCYLYSLQGLYICLRSGVYIFTHSANDISFSLSGGSKKINLWHGIPLKKINYDNEYDQKRNPHSLVGAMLTFSQRMRKERPTHYILSTSDHVASMFTGTFKIPLNNIIVAGYPRNDVLFSDPFKYLNTTEEINYFNGIYRSEKKEKEIVLVYLPTFRTPEHEKDIFKHLDLEEFDVALKELKIRIIFKLHPKSKIKNEFTKYEYTNISLAPWSIDPYPLVAASDGLITDYSSIFFDYLLVDKPMVFFSYDLADYIKHSRGLYYDYATFVPGPIVKTQVELIHTIQDVYLNGQDEYIQKRMHMKNLFFKHHDGLSSQRLFDEIYRLATK